MSSVSDPTLPLSAIATRRFGELHWTPARTVLFAALVFAFLPLLAGEYWLNAVLIPFLVMSLAGVGLNLLMGYTGQASLGTGAFMAVGTYATYNFLLRAPELPLPISLVLGGLVASFSVCRAFASRDSTCWRRHWRPSSSSNGCSTSTAGSRITAPRTRFPRRALSFSAVTSRVRSGATT